MSLKGLCAPGALVRNDTVHLFYQTYGNGAKDAVCHAWSEDGIHFVRNATKSYFFSGKGSGIAGVPSMRRSFFLRISIYLYYATRTPDYSTQVIGVAMAPAHTDFSKQAWKSRESSVLVPSILGKRSVSKEHLVVQMGDEMFMFYAGAYNNRPQQIGVAKSSDGITGQNFLINPF